MMFISVEGEESEHPSLTQTGSCAEAAMRSDKQNMACSVFSDISWIRNGTMRLTVRVCENEVTSLDNQSLSVDRTQLPGDSGLFDSPLAGTIFDTLRLRSEQERH
ncbi:hypothetical protein RRG08_064888 [Elysia crispata]|uniref:Uncharacterized protein n=1 Tax=Elysia crispata TaxID=231223 RepID=A0AAE1AY88_9GAST|nr:hypothetical protein RRG08_064888 [Elysia crispata]